MLDNLKATLKNSLIYSLGNVSAKIAGFILIPLYTSYLTISDFGILAILEISTQFLVSVFNLKLAYAFMRFYWEDDFQQKRKSVFFTTFIFLICISLTTFALFSMFLGQLSVLLFNSASYVYLLRLVLISAASQIIFNLIITHVRIEEKSVFFSVINVIRLIFTLTLTIYFVVDLNRGIEGIYEAQIIGIAVASLGLIKYAIQHFSYRIEWRVLKEMLSYSIPLIFAEVSAVVFNITSRYALNFLATLEAVGVFSLGFKIANTINVLILASVMLAIGPMIYKKINDPDNKRFYAKIMTYLGYGLMICILWVSLFSREIVKVLAQNKNYWDASYVIPIIALTIFFTMLRDISLTGLHITKKTKIVAIAISSMAVINILLNIILIPIWNFMGAALATLFAQILFFIAIYKIAQKKYHIPYELTKILKIMGVAIGIFFVGQLTNDYELWMRLVLKHLLLLSFPVLLYFWNFYDQVELDRVASIKSDLINQIKRRK